LANFSHADFRKVGKKLAKNRKKKKRFETLQTVLKTANPAWKHGLKHFETFHRFGLIIGGA